MICVMDKFAEIISCHNCDQKSFTKVIIRNSKMGYYDHHHRYLIDRETVRNSNILILNAAVFIRH